MSLADTIIKLLCDVDVHNAPRNFSLGNGQPITGLETNHHQEVDGVNSFCCDGEWTTSRDPSTTLGVCWEREVILSLSPSFSFDVHDVI